MLFGSTVNAVIRELSQAANIFAVRETVIASPEKTGELVYSVICLWKLIKGVELRECDETVERSCVSRGSKQWSLIEFRSCVNVRMMP